METGGGCGSSGRIKILPGYDRPEEIKELFTEYTQMLIAGDATFRQYLEVQNYEEEVRNLETKYGRPEGRLYLAFLDGKTAGCIGLRKIDAENCEMKRLYVRPAFRGEGIGQALVERILGEAKAIGYRHMFLDTLPFLESALKLYYACGFYEVESYNNSPMKEAIYLKLDLSSVFYGDK